MQIAICEDERNTLLELKELIAGEGRSVDLYEDSRKLFARCKGKMCYDVVFTDMVMDDMNGMDLCRKLKEINPQVIVVVITNYIEYAPLGYENGVFRYLLKPVKKEELDQVFADIRKARRKKHKFVVDALQGSKILSQEDLLYVEIRGRYIDIYYEEQECTMMMSLKEFWSRLDNQLFFRIHRNYLVNLGHVREFSASGLQLDNGTRLPISRRNSAPFREALLRYLSSTE